MPAWLFKCVALYGSGIMYYCHIQLIMFTFATATSGAIMQKFDTYFHPDPPVVGKPLTIHLNGVICKKLYIKLRLMLFGLIPAS